MRWDIEPKDYLAVAAVVQKFVDQACSFNTNHNDQHYGGEIPMSVLMADHMLAYKYGIKCLYYANPAPNKIVELIDEQPTQTIEEQEDCDSCKI